MEECVKISIEEYNRMRDVVEDKTIKISEDIKSYVDYNRTTFTTEITYITPSDKDFFISNFNYSDEGYRWSYVGSSDFYKNLIADLDRLQKVVNKNDKDMQNILSDQRRLYHEQLDKRVNEIENRFHNMSVKDFKKLKKDIKNK